MIEEERKIKKKTTLKDLLKKTETPDPTNNKSLCDDFKQGVYLSVRYKDPLISLSNDRLTASIGAEGWSTVLLTHGASSGCYYFEVSLNQKVPSSHSRPNKPHWRVGWSCRYLRYDSPVGSDEFSFALRDVDGSIINMARRKPLFNSSLENEDLTVGCAIVLPPPCARLPDPRKRPELHLFVEGGLLCDPELPPPVSTNEGSCIDFCVQGHSPKRGFNDLPCGTYHPAISLYMGAVCTLNPGPSFALELPQLTETAKTLTGFDRYFPACLLPPPEYP